MALQASLASWKDSNDANRITMNRILQFPGRVWRFYAEGFRSMTIGRKLWAIIIIKLIVIFGILKLFFFPDILHSSYDTDVQRADAVRSSLAMPRGSDTF